MVSALLLLHGRALSAALRYSFEDVRHGTEVDSELNIRNGGQNTILALSCGLQYR